MWNHEIVEGMSWYHITKVEEHKLEKIHLYAIEDLVKKAPTFFFGEHSLALKPTLEKYNGNYQKLFPFKVPYNACIFEYKYKDSYEQDVAGWTQEPSTKRAILMANTPIKQMFYSLYYTDKTAVWNVCPVRLVSYESEGWCYGFESIFPSMDSVFGEENINHYIQEMKDEMNVAIVMLDILNCQNVVTKDVVPPEKLNRKRIRNGKLPLYTYKILEVVKGKPKSKNAGSVTWDYQSPASVRFHLCRGHFKTFTPDKPLFGKYSGTFWWNPQSRGNKELGEIEKDYDVKVV